MKFVLFVLFSMVILTLTSAAKIKQCRVWGDPHYYTQQKKTLHLQYYGDETLAETDHFLVQGRTQEWTKDTTVLTKVAIKVISHQKRFSSFKKDIKIIYDGKKGHFRVNGEECQSRTCSNKLHTTGVHIYVVKHKGIEYDVVRKGNDFILVTRLGARRVSGSHQARHYLDVIVETYDFHKNIGLCVNGSPSITQQIFDTSVPRGKYKLVKSYCFKNHHTYAVNECSNTYNRQSGEYDACVFDLCRGLTIADEKRVQEALKQLKKLIQKYSMKAQQHLEHHKNYHALVIDHKQKIEKAVKTRNKHLNLVNHHKKKLKNLGNQINAQRNQVKSYIDKAKKFKQLYNKYAGLCRAGQQKLVKFHKKVLRHYNLARRERNKVISWNEIISKLQSKIRLYRLRRTEHWKLHKTYRKSAKTARDESNLHKQERETVGVSKYVKDSD